MNAYTSPNSAPIIAPANGNAISEPIQSAPPASAPAPRLPLKRGKMTERPPYTIPRRKERMVPIRALP